mmetsp:Transcript_35901/g.99542  ORF Transcript_35901/g.99542 Transcript_35901/m.99542 type:complete len:218 (+) Transcript_35901:67-720(+)
MHNRSSSSGRPFRCSNPQAALSIAALEALPVAVRFSDHLQRCLPVQRLLAKAKCIQGLAVRCLVPTEPLTDAGEDPRHLGTHVRNVLQVSRGWIIKSNGDDLPIELAVIYHCEGTQDLDSHHISLRVRAGADLHDVHRVVVPKNTQLWVLHGRVFPGLGKVAVVPIDGPMVVAEFAFFDVLGNGVARLLRCDLHLGLGHLRNLCHHPVLALGPRLQW